MELGLPQVHGPSRVLGALSGGCGGLVPRPPVGLAPRLGEGQHSQGTYLATSLKVFFLVMPAPLAVLPFQGSGYGE